MTSIKLTCSEPNYCAQVVRIHTLLDCEGLDNLKAIPAYGYSALVSKDHNIGELGILFVAETQLSEEFCHNNNMYRHSELNKDKEAKGYIEDSRRVRAIRLRGNTSTALFLPLSSLSYLEVNPEDFQEGDAFDSVNGKEVCRKYKVVHQQSQGNKVRGKNKKFCRVDALMFPEHGDTANYWRNIHTVKDDDWVIVTAKIHGSSARFANTVVKRQLTWKERVAKFFGIKVQEHEYDTLAGSRRVVKDLKGTQDFEHYYDKDIWNSHLEKIQHLIPKNWILYGEIIGWVGGKAIQKNYTYQIPRGESEFYVYRICVINENGITVDLTWKQIKEWTTNNGLKHVPEIWQGYHKDFDEEPYMNQKFVKDLRLFQCLPLDKEANCDEGLCIRVDGIKPYILKAKSPVFLLHETKLLDKGEEDIETLESLENSENE